MSLSGCTVNLQTFFNKSPIHRTGILFVTTLSCMTCFIPPRLSWPKKKVEQLCSDLLLDKRHDADSGEHRLPTQALPRHAICERLGTVSHWLAQVPHKERHVSPGEEKKEDKYKGWRTDRYAGNVRFVSINTAHLNSFSVLPLRSLTSHWEAKASWDGIPQRITAFRKAFRWRVLNPSTYWYWKY